MSVLVEILFYIILLNIVLNLANIWIALGLNRVLKFSVETTELLNASVWLGERTALFREFEAPSETYD